MLHEYHVICSVRYYPRFHVTAVGLGTYYPWIRGHYSIIILDYNIMGPPWCMRSVDRNVVMWRIAVLPHDKEG
jgi:hypothetical protein